MRWFNIFSKGLGQKVEDDLALDLTNHLSHLGLFPTSLSRRGGFPKYEVICTLERFF